MPNTWTGSLEACGGDGCFQVIVKQLWQTDTLRSVVRCIGGRLCGLLSNSMHGVKLIPQKIHGLVTTAVPLSSLRLPNHEFLPLPSAFLVLMLPPVLSWWRWRGQRSRHAARFALIVRLHTAIALFNLITELQRSHVDPKRCCRHQSQQRILHKIRLAGRASFPATSRDEHVRSLVHNILALLGAISAKRDSSTRSPSPGKMQPLVHALRLALQQDHVSPQQAGCSKITLQKLGVLACSHGEGANQRDGVSSSSDKYQAANQLPSSASASPRQMCTIGVQTNETRLCTMMASTCMHDDATIANDRDGPGESVQLSAHTDPLLLSHHGALTHVTPPSLVPPALGQARPPPPPPTLPPPPPPLLTPLLSRPLLAPARAARPPPASQRAAPPSMQDLARACSRLRPVHTAATTAAMAAAAATTTTTAAEAAAVGAAVRASAGRSAAANGGVRVGVTGGVNGSGSVVAAEAQGDRSVGTAPRGGVCAGGITISAEMLASVTLRPTRRKQHSSRSGSAELSTEAVLEDAGCLTKSPNYAHESTHTHAHAHAHTHAKACARNEADELLRAARERLLSVRVRTHGDARGVKATRCLALAQTSTRTDARALAHISTRTTAHVTTRTTAHAAARTTHGVAAPPPLLTLTMMRAQRSLRKGLARKSLRSDATERSDATQRSAASPAISHTTSLTHSTSFPHSACVVRRTPSPNTLSITPKPPFPPPPPTSPPALLSKPAESPTANSKVYNDTSNNENDASLSPRSQLGLHGTFQKTAAVNYERRRDSRAALLRRASVGARTGSPLATIYKHAR